MLLILGAGLWLTRVLGLPSQRQVTGRWLWLKIKLEGLQVLVHVSTYQGSILVPFF